MKPPTDGLRLQELLAEGLDDWVPLHDVAWHARELAVQTGAEVAVVAREVLRSLIGDGLMAPGDLGDSGLDLWAGDPEELIERTMAQCEALAWNPRGEGCWFANTAAGDRAAHGLEPTP